MLGVGLFRIGWEQPRLWLEVRGQMDARILDEILATDKRIRYAGILSSDLKTVASKKRDDLNLMDEEEYADDALVNLAAPVILGTLSRFAGRCGKLICSGVRFAKVTLLFFRMDETCVVVSTEPGPPYIIMQKLEENLRM
jgi:hypothetical protein